MVFASLQAQNYPLDGADNWDQTGFKLLNIVPLLWSWISLDQLYHLSDPTTTPYFLKNGTPATLSQNNPDVIVSCSCVSLCHVVNMCYCVSFPSNPIFQKRKFARDKCFIGGFCWIEVCSAYPRFLTVPRYRPTMTGVITAAVQCALTIVYRPLHIAHGILNNTPQCFDLIPVSKLKRVILFLDA